ncbi:MAG: hypothetical protein IJI37_06165 [Opitutales bacterium]|nr:hypothetical protein [Opitutales bacterium]
MKFFRTLLAIALPCAAFGDGGGNSLFTQVFLHNALFGPMQVLEIYSGSWSGTQEISANGQTAATALVEQTYLPSRGAEPRLVGSGKISGMGASIPTRSFMFVENGALRLDVRTQDGRDVPYAGVIDGSSVVWVPLNFFMLYDSQTDTFSNTSEGIVMRSRGVKYVKIPSGNFEGYIEVSCEMRKLKPAYPSQNVRTTGSAKFSAPSAKMAD